MIDLEDYSPSVEDEQLIIHDAAYNTIYRIAYDTRTITQGEGTVFVAIKGQLHDGHQYIDQAYKMGVKIFIISDKHALDGYDDVNYLLCTDTIRSLQRLVLSYKSKYPSLLCIGITGSNGKTMVKEWLANMLAKKYQIVKTPKSYNSQLGTALSIWGINEDHEIGIFEAGISASGEMIHLQKLIDPQVGILTNIGSAHDTGFENKAQKLVEKLVLFKNAHFLIFNGDDDFLHAGIKNNLPNIHHLSWGRKNHNAVQILSAENDAELKLKFNNHDYHFTLSQTSAIYFENVMQCIVAALHFEVQEDQIQHSISDIEFSDISLHLVEGKDGCAIINDAYTNDINALKIALDFLKKHGTHTKRILVLSELEQASRHAEKDVLDLLKLYDLDQIILVGEKWIKYPLANYIQLSNTKEAIQYLSDSDISDATILIKGARRFKFEQIHAALSIQSHSVSLEVDMAALEHNLGVYASITSPGVGIVPIIKASAYGTGSVEVAKLMQYKGVFGIGVAFADEGKELRQAGITIPIIVLNSDENSYDDIHDYNLEVEVYGTKKLESILSWQNGKLAKTRLHLKLDTGMSRLGMKEEDMDKLCTILQEKKPTISTIFSHLASSEDEADDDFTHQQASLFNKYYTRITQVLGYKPRRHLVNSAGIVRFPEYHYELVRLGIGLYGIDSDVATAVKLEKVHTLKAKIIQIKNLEKGDSIGYNRRYKATQHMKIGILNIGYADGLMRQCGNEKYSVKYGDQLAPILGNVCMDLTIIDLSNIPAIEEGDEVVIFGKSHPIESLAKICHTIPYEILTRLAPRIVRRYIG
jgi:Alr-MurF fusion protein